MLYTFFGISRVYEMTHSFTALISLLQYYLLRSKIVASCVIICCYELWDVFKNTRPLALLVGRSNQNERKVVNYEQNFRGSVRK
jgi:hypothetical protein